MKQDASTIIIEAFAGVFVAIILAVQKEAISSFAKGFISKLKSKVKDKKEEAGLIIKDPLVDRIKSDGLALGMLENIAEEFGADRTYLLQFSNGNFYESGSSIKKISCSHEWVRAGISRKQHLLQDVLVSTIPFYLNDVVEDKAQYKYVEKVKSPALKELMEVYGIKSMVGIPIYDNQGRIIAVFGMEWVKQTAEAFCDTMSKDIYNTFKEQIQEFKLYL